MYLEHRSSSAEQVLQTVKTSDMAFSFTPNNFLSNLNFQKDKLGPDLLTVFLIVAIVVGMSNLH